MVCGVWCVVCGVWFVVCGVFLGVLLAQTVMIVNERLMTLGPKLLFIEMVQNGAREVPRGILEAQVRQTTGTRGQAGTVP